MTDIELASKSKAQELMAWAMSMQIVDAETRAMATVFRLETQKAIKTIKDWIDPAIKKAHETHKELTNKRRELVEPYERAQEIVDAKLSNDYMSRQKLNDEQQEELRRLNSGGSEWSPDIVLAPVQSTTSVDGGSVNIINDIDIEVINKLAVLKGIVDHKYPLGYAEIDTAYIKRDVKQMNWTQIDGIKITKTAIVRGRSK